MSAEKNLGPPNDRVIATTRGLVHFLRELVQATTVQVSDVLASKRYRSVIWIGDLPDGVPEPTSDNEIILSLDYEAPTVPPTIPERLAGRLEPASVEKADGDDPPLLYVEPDENDAGQPSAEAIRQAYEAWLPHWRHWAQLETAAMARRELYRRLADDARLLSQQDDQYEAVLGIGLLSWAPQHRDIKFDAIS